MASEIKDRVKERVTEQVETRLADTRTRAAGHVSAVAETLHSSSDDLRDRGEEKVSQYVDKAAEQVERVAAYLKDADVGEVVDRVERFARREPAAFMAGAFAVGFLASRLLKSSRENGYTSDYGTRETGYPMDSGTRESNYTTGYGTLDTGYETNRGL